MADILARIEAYKRREINEAKLRLPQAEIERRCADCPPVRGFASAIAKRMVSGQTALIAEVKKASPSKGLIRADFDPASIARAYELGGACCLSVLTDAPSFQGKPEFLAEAREATRLPTLRKDFLYDPYQVYEARLWGADCILVIMAGVDDATARALTETAKALDLDVLVEVHDREELERALHLDPLLVGINNRDLRSFETSLDVTERLAPRVPAGKIVVGESGIFTPADVSRLARVGVRALLVGESLMRQDNIEAATRALLARPAAETAT